MSATRKLWGVDLQNLHHMCGHTLEGGIQKWTVFLYPPARKVVI
eukprot:UN21808